MLAKILNNSVGSKSPAFRVATQKAVGPAPHYDWDALADGFLWRWYNDPERRKDRERGIFHPSQGLHHSTETCKRAIVFELIYAPMSPTQIHSRLAKVLWNGNNRHVGLQDLFHEMATNNWRGIVKAEREVGLSHAWLPIYGHADERVTVVSGHKYMFDFKTWSAKKCETLFEPEFKHKLQLNTYMGMDGEAHTGYMIYERKDDQKWIGLEGKKFRIDFDRQLFTETEEFCHDILTIVAQESLPEFDEEECKGSISFCWYREACLAEREGKVSGWEELDKRPESVKRRHLEVVK